MELIWTIGRPPNLGHKTGDFSGARDAPLDLGATPLPAKSTKDTNLLKIYIFRFFGKITPNLGVRSYFSFITLDILCLGPCMVLMDKFSIYDVLMTSRTL